MHQIYLYRRVVQAKIFIDTNFGEDIDLNNISDEACFSKFHFIRLFKNIYGLTPYKYLTKVRIEKARILLSSDMSVTEVCFCVGFDSVSSFTGLFKKTVGMTPSVFQHFQLKRKEEINLKPLNFIPNCFAESKGWKNSNFQEVK